jgi:molybdopterin/thiamine biosynthesis adenylyltransferase/rhodanese-related sulfurtransferase
MSVLDEQLRRRYARQIALPEFGEEGQARLAESRVLVVGLGGLGSPAALYLVAAGVGHLSLVEYDRVDVTNLQRQVHNDTSDDGRPKLEAAAARLKALNPDLGLATIDVPLDADNAVDLVKGHDVVLDGTDNFVARYAVNDACVLTRTPNVHGAVQGFEGQVMVLAAEDGPCYRCLFPEPPAPGSVPSCAEAGILGVLPGTIGLLQATETLKLLTGIGEPLVGRMLRFDALAARFTEIRLAVDPDCPACGPDSRMSRPEAVEDICTPVAPQRLDLPFTISIEELARRQDQNDAPELLDVRLPEEVQLAAMKGDFRHIPLHLLPTRLSELDATREYAVICHHGVRSTQAVHFLRANGIPGARDVPGGIDRWSDEVDPSVPRY